MPSHNPKGRVLYIGASYYNNWYLSRSLRDLGWKADLLTYSAESTDLYLHGYDFSLKDYATGDTQFNERLFNFLRYWLRRYAEEQQNNDEQSKGKADALLSLLGSLFRFLLVRRFNLAKSIIEFVLRDKRRLDGGVQKAWHVRSIDFLYRGKRNVLSRILGPILLEALRGSEHPEPLKNLLRFFLTSMRKTKLDELDPIYKILDGYDILHFTGMNNLRYFYFINPWLFGSMPIGWDVQLLKCLGKKIVYSNIGCLDGVSQSSFRSWPPEPVCDICRWRDEPTVCSDERNLAWGKLRNSLADYQINLGGNRKDYNDDPRVHEVPEFYCLDTKVWDPDLPVPPQYRLQYPEDTVKIYHAVGNFESRTGPNNRNIKCTHIYVPLIERLKREGYKVELLFYSNVPNKDIRFYQVQADIVVDMLTFGWFGATGREAMMLGKPYVCFIRPEWLETMRQEIPEYVDELPVVSATPDTVYDVLKDLILHPEKRMDIGRRSRDFAVKWHSAEAGAKHFDRIYADLLS